VHHSTGQRTITQYWSQRIAQQFFRRATYGKILKVSGGNSQDFLAPEQLAKVSGQTMLSRIRSRHQNKTLVRPIAIQAQRLYGLFYIG